MIYLAILNITSWVGQCADAEHLYGHLILSTKEEVTIDNVDEWNVKYLGENIELFRPLTLEVAKALDEKEGGKTYQRHFRWMQEGVTTTRELEEYSKTNRFDTFDEVVNAGIEKWKELNCDCLFISLYEGKRYYSNSFNSAESVILTNKHNDEKKDKKVVE